MRRIRVRFIAAALFAIAAVSGCGKIQRLYIVDDALSDRDTTSTDGSEAPGPLNLDTYIFHEDLIKDLKIADAETNKERPVEEINQLKLLFIPNSNAIKSAYSKALDSKKHRNRLQLDIIRRSNEICEVHQGAILAKQAFLSFSTGLIATVLSGISAAVGGEAAKTALSTASAAVGATGAEIDSNFYQNLLATAIVRKINELRASQYNRILTEQTKRLEDYSVNHAVLDASIYHSKCSFFVGVIALATDTREDLSFAQIRARIDALHEENAELARIVKDGPEERKLAAELQLRLNETEIVRLTLLSRSASGAPAAKTADVMSLSGQIDALTTEIAGLESRISGIADASDPRRQELERQRDIKKGEKAKLENQLRELPTTVMLRMTAKSGQSIQGVGFRKDVVEKAAIAQGLVGCAKIQANGSVTAVLSGGRAKIDAAIREIENDPRVQVEDPKASDTPYEGEGFKIIEPSDRTACGDST